MATEKTAKATTAKPRAKAKTARKPATGKSSAAKSAAAKLKADAPVVKPKAKAGPKDPKRPAPASGPDQLLTTLAETIESGAGMPAVTRAAGRALGVSIAVIDRSSAVLAVAAQSADEERKLISGATGVESLDLKVAGAKVGELRLRRRSKDVGDGLVRAVSALLALELERSRSPEWASDEAARAFVRAVLGREVTDAAEIVTRAATLGTDLESGAGVIVARISPDGARRKDWRARALTISGRAVRTVSAGTLSTLVRDGTRTEVQSLVPLADETQLAKTAATLQRELTIGLEGFGITVGYSRWTDRASDLFRAGKEALLATNVAEAEGTGTLAFEDTGSYRLLLATMSEDPGELERFYLDTIAPLVAYDEQYGTELVATVEAFLANDGNIGPTAEQLFAHRHTIRYRLGRVRDLCGHDIDSSDGRERLSFGLKVMRVMGIGSLR